MTAARHARPPAATRPATAATVALIVLLAVALLTRLGGNVAPAAPWRYPCTELVAGRVETFEPYRLLMEGRCLQ